MSISWPIKVDFEENVNPYPGSATDPDIISGGQNSSSYAMNSGSSNNKSWHLKDSSYNWISDVKAISFWHKPVAKTGTNDGDLPVIFMAHEDDTRPTGWDNGSWLYFAMDLISSSGKYYIHQKSNKSCASKWYINGVEAVESGTAEKIASDFTGSVYVDATMDTWTHHYIEFHVTMKHLIFMNDYNANNDRYRGTGSIDNIYFLNEAQTTSTISDLSNNIPFDKSLTDISNNFLISSSLVTTKEIDDYFESITGLLTFNQTESNTFFTDLSNNSNTNAVMSYIGLKIIKITPALGEFVVNSLYTSLDTTNDSFTFDNLVDVTAATIFDASNNADISVGDTTPTTNEKEIFKAAKTLSFRKLRKDLKSTELETKIKDISATDVDANITTYLNTINKNLSLNLTGFDLSGVDLTGTDLSGATLVDTDLSGANLTNANLTYVDISGADITNTNLKNSTFTDISNVQNATGVALNVPYKYQYFNNQLTASTTNLTQSYTTNNTKIGPFKEGEKITINGVQIVFGKGISEAGLLGIDKNQNGDSFTFLQDDNNITTWGNTYTGGDQPTDISNVKAIYSTKRAKTAMYEDGKIMSWGDSDYGGDTPSNVSGLIDVKANEKAFVGLYNDGTITCWGDASTGGTKPADISNVVQLYSNKNAFSALSSDGTVKSWGSLNSTTAPTDNKFVDIFSTDTAFAGLKSDGTVKCWGSSDTNQNTPPTDLSNVSVIFSNQTAFAALLGDSTVQCWGNTTNGGTTPTDISNVDSIYCTNSAFTALLKDDNIVCWGDSNSGGTKPTVSEKTVKTETPIIVKCNENGVFKFEDISSTELNLSFTTNHSDSTQRSNVGFISGSSLYFKHKSYDEYNVDYGEVFVSNNEFDTNSGDHTFVFKTFPYKEDNANQHIYIGFVKDYGSTYQNKYTASVFNVNSSENPYVEISNPSWIYSTQWELTFTLTSTGLTVTGGGDTITVNNSITNGGKYRLVININNGAMFELKNAFTTPYPKLEYGKKYKFSQSHWTNTGNTLKFSSSDLDYALIEKSESFGTPGNTGAYTTLCLTDDNIQQLYVYSEENKFSSGIKHKVVQFEIKRIVVTVVGNKFVFDGDQNTNPTINHNTLYIFDVSDSSNSGHPLSFSKNSSNLQAYNVNRTGTEGTADAIVTFKNNDINNTNFYVFCKTHGLDMGSHYNPISISNILTRNIVNNFKKIYSTQTAFAGLKHDGTIITWGNTNEGGTFPPDSNSSPPNLTNKFEIDITDVILSTRYFAATNINDGLIQYGQNLGSSDFPSHYTDEDRDSLAYDISKIAHTTSEMAVLRRNGKIICLGENTITTNTKRIQHRINSDCIDVISTDKGFCAIKNDGTVVSWGQTNGGANESDLYNLSNVKKVVATLYSFAALKNDGSVVAWGNKWTQSHDKKGYLADDTGAAGNTSLVDADINSGVIDLYSNDYGFVAIKDDGTGNGTYKVINWSGQPSSSGNFDAANSSKGIRNHAGVVDVSLLNSNIKKVIPCGVTNFVIIKSDNKAYVWGDFSSRVGSSAEKLGTLTNIKEVIGADQAIAFLKYDGSVVAWGGQSAAYGGKIDDSNDGVRNYSGVIDKTVLDSNIVKIFANQRAFCALSDDGKVYTWGEENYGGNYHHGTHGLPPHLSVSDLTDIVKVTGIYNYSKDGIGMGGFGALKKNGKIVYWGYNGNNITGIRNVDISKNSFVDIMRVQYSNYNNYYALHSNGTIHTLGYDTWKHLPYIKHNNYNQKLDYSRFSQSFIPGSYKAPKTVLRWDTERVAKYVAPTNMKNSNFVNVFSTDKAFAGLKKDGTIIVWGDNGYGGNQSDVTGQKNIQHIFSNSRSFTAVKQDNTMCIWGGRGYGVLEATTGDIKISSNLQEINSYIEPYRKSNLLTMFNVHADTRKILEESYNSNESANIILKTDGTATTWGNTTHGGVSSNLTLTNVKEVVTGGNNMSVLKSDGTLATWSNNTDQSTTSTNVKKVVSGLSGNVIALKADGTVEYWDPDLANWNIGSNINTANLPNLTGVVDVFAFDKSFAALDKDDALTVWGDDPALEPFNSTEKKKLTFDDNATRFGQGLAINDTYAFISAPESEENSNSQSGCVFVYKKDEGGTDNWGQIKKITPEDDLGNDDSEASLLFGGGSSFSYGIRGESNVTNYNDYLAVGTSNYSSRSAGDGEGAVYIFKKDEGGADNWGQIKKITVSSLNYFGMSVKLYEDYLIVGTVGDGAYIFKKDQGGTDNWGQLKILNPSVNAELTSGNGGFGYPVAIHNNHIAVGSLSQEKIYIFQKDHGGSDNWGEINIVTEGLTDPRDYYGKTFEIYDDYMAVGAMYWDGAGTTGTNAGAVYVYKKDYDPLTPNDISANAWGQLKILSSPQPPNGNTNGQKQFGICTSIYGDYIIGGTWQEDIEYNVIQSVGAAYIFKKDEGGTDNWGQVKKLQASDKTAYHKFGQTCTIDNNFLIVGRPESNSQKGGAYIFDLSKPSTDTNLLTNISSKAAQLSSGVKEVIANSKVLIALKYDGTVVTQGDSTLGGDISNSGAQYKLYGGTADNIAKVYLNNKFAMALKKDRTCVYWGDISRNTTLFNTDISAFTNIRDIVYSNDVMVGIKYDGTVVGLGEKSKGGNPSFAIKNVDKVFATTNNGFTALKTDGNIVVWGDTSYGGQL